MVIVTHPHTHPVTQAGQLYIRGMLDWSNLSASTVEHVESSYCTRVYQWDSFITSSSQLPTSYSAAPLAGGVDLSHRAAAWAGWLHRVMPSSARYVPIPAAWHQREEQPEGESMFPGAPRTLGMCVCVEMSLYRCAWRSMMWFLCTTGADTGRVSPDLEAPLADKQALAAAAEARMRGGHS